MIRSFFLLSVAVSVVACGGGSGSGSGDTVQNTPVPQPTPAVVRPVDIKSTVFAFAALMDDGRVKTWGFPEWGGDSSGVQSRLTNVKSIYSNPDAFAALKNDGSVVTWGQSETGGDSSAASAELFDIVDIVAARRGFSALRADGTAITWGAPYSQGFDSPLVPNVQTLLASDTEYSAIGSDGTVTLWGGFILGSSQPEPLFEQLGPIAQNPTATSKTAVGNFSAALSSGSIVTWGRANAFDEVPAPDNLSTVDTLFSTGLGALAQLADGTTRYWGAKASDDVRSTPPESLTDVSNVVFSGNYAAAATSDGRVSGWINFPTTFDTELAQREVDRYITFPDSLSNIDSIYADGISGSSSSGIFVAIDNNQQVWSWSLGELTQPVLTGAMDVAISKQGFIVLQDDGAIEIVGGVELEIDTDTGAPVVQPLLSEVVAIYSSTTSYAVVREDGSIVTFGRFVDDGLVD